ALAHLAREESQEYRSICARALELFADAKDIATVNTTVWTCLLSPGTVSDINRLVELARKNLAKAPERNTYGNTLGAALHRKGDYEESIKVLQEALQAHARGGTAVDWLFLALAYQWRGMPGDADQARQWYDKAIQAIDERRSSKPSHDRPIRTYLPWYERLE